MIQCSKCLSHGRWMVQLINAYSTPGQFEYLCLDCLKLEMELDG